MRRRILILAALSAASAAILRAAPAQYLGRQQDDLLYIITSHAMAEGSCRVLTLLGQPPSTVNPPGLSILMLPVTWLCGECYGAYQAFCAALMALVPWLLWWWLRRRLGETESVLAALVFATSPLVLCQAGTVMSEAAYTALLIFFLAAAQAGRPRACGAALLALTQIRPAGYSLFPAALERAWREKNWRAACWSGLPALAGALVWYGWSYSVSAQAGEFHELNFSYSGQPWRYPLAVVFDNLRFYLTESGAGLLPWRWSAAALPVAAALAALACRGAWRLRRERQARPALLMLAGAAFMHAFWPWHYDRYLIPLLPWLLWLIAAGTGAKARWLLGLILVLQLSFHTPYWLSGASDWRQPELSRTYAWLRGHTTPANAIASALPVRDGFYTGRAALSLLDASGAAGAGRLSEALRRGRIRFAIWQDDLDTGLSVSRTATVSRRLYSVQKDLEDSGYFRLIHEEPAEHARIYEPR